MAGTFEAKLTEMGLSLPAPVAPLAAYVPFVRVGDLLFVSGQLPMTVDGLHTGHLTGASAEQEIAAAKDAAQVCAVNILAQVKAATGDLDHVMRVVKLTGFVSCDGTFHGHPQVINGASELMGAVFGEVGQHARAAVGSSALPLGAVVEVEGIFQLS